MSENPLYDETANTQPTPDTETPQEPQQVEPTSAPEDTETPETGVLPEHP